MSFQAVGPEVPKERWAVWEPVEFNDNELESMSFVLIVQWLRLKRIAQFFSERGVEIPPERSFGTFQKAFEAGSRHSIMSIGDGYNILLFKSSSIIRNDFMESTSQ